MVTDWRRPVGWCLCLVGCLALLRLATLRPAAPPSPTSSTLLVSLPVDAELSWILVDTGSMLVIRQFQNGGCDIGESHVQPLSKTVLPPHSLGDPLELFPFLLVMKPIASPLNLIAISLPTLQ
ncbi:unnamed protein product [Nezara viridula]|uniref:Neuropeptide n=1 Tax=Nezara viridula TaxID=85310 RepID=A0A9P0MSQ3_NEZVI|nr:unnamed protein product [Nezara viridula]